MVRKGGDPTNKTNNITPKANMSAFSPLYSPYYISGALNPSVPTFVFNLKSLSAPSLKVESPKSDIFSLKSRSKSIFYGLISRWATPFYDKYSIPFNS